MHIAASSDLHGTLPTIPPCDLLLIAGDVCPTADHSTLYQHHWLETEFRAWLKEVPAKRIVGIAGNHDFIFQRAPGLVADLDLPWTYLRDSGTEIDGLKVWGTPWSHKFFNWAFMVSEDRLKDAYDLIPDDTDILLSHGPPYGLGDEAPDIYGDGFIHVGSPHLLRRLAEVRPRLCVFGHIHEGHGVHSAPDAPSFIANTSLMDAGYRPTNPVLEFDL